MKDFLFYSLVSVFAIFIGSQITEGVLLVPYWQSMKAQEFYNYYQEFGHSIGRFYTILTVAAALIPISIAVYARRIKSNAFSPATVSTLFALLFIGCFYVYFKGTNELFFQEAFTEAELKEELIVWAKWHWSRILLEFISLIFLIMALIKLKSVK